MTSSTKPPVEWTLLYHAPGKMKGRGEYLRLLLEDAGASYENSDVNLYGPTGMMDAFRASPEAIDKINDHYPVFFPPAIWHRPVSGEEVLINQVGACMIYLGDQLGYAPQSAAETARANCTMLNALDYVSDGRSSFHPIKNSMSYKDQKEEGDKVSKEFSQTRMKLFLHHFNKVIKSNGSSPENPIAGGSTVTYADFVLFYALDATASQFNSEFYEKAWDNTNVPELKAYYKWIQARPKLQAYFKSDRCARKLLNHCSESIATCICFSINFLIFSGNVHNQIAFYHSFCWRQHDVILIKRIFSTQRTRVRSLLNAKPYMTHDTNKNLNSHDFQLSFVLGWFPIFSKK